MNKSDWLPIETAPIKPFDKDNWSMATSPHVLLWNGHFCVIGVYAYTRKGKGRWQDWHANTSPTHWMPLPDGPEA